MSDDHALASTSQAARVNESRTAPRRIEQLVYQLRSLRMIGTVLHLGAHPDDEDAGLLAFMSRRYGARIVYWSATRGEAGQNRLGSYSGEALAVYRTWESLAARAIDGAESLFGPFIDFGFSKNGAEAAAKWGEDELVAEIVRAIRVVQPQIVIARFAGEPGDGHGQHQAIGSATLKAFDAAADPLLFREFGLPAWRPAKLYQSTGGDWQPGEEHALGKLRPEFERDGFVRIDTGELDPIAGLTYQQQAWLAFNCHQSQAMGFLPERGRFYYYYRLARSLVASPAREESFYDGVDPTLLGLLDYPGGGPADMRDTLEAVRQRVDAGLSRLQPDDPSPAAGPLLQGHALLRHLRRQLSAPDSHPALARIVDYKLASFEEVIVGCLGLAAECVAERAHVGAGESVRITAQFWNPRAVPIEATELRLVLPPGWRVARAIPGEASSRPDARTGEHEVAYEVAVPAEAPATTPYWLKESHGPYRYTIARQDFACEPFGPAIVSLRCDVLVAGQVVSLRRPALHREPFAGGYREIPLSVIPAASVKPQTYRLFLPAGRERYEKDLHAAVQRNVDLTGRAIQLGVVPPQGWSVTPSAARIAAGRPGETTPVRFRLAIPSGTGAGTYALEFRLGSGAEQPAVALEPVWMGAPGLPRPPDAATCIREAFLAKPARVDVHVIGANFAPKLRYAYVRGAAEGLLDALNDFALDVQVIGDEEIGYLDLSAFDAIVMGPNAYLVRDAVRRDAGRFLEYVARGGTLVVQYQGYGYEHRDFTPYPFHYRHPHDRVTYPDAPVTILEPRHLLMTYPNEITQEDFTGWIHDRGLYFFGDFDRRYVPILGCNDPGEDLKHGGLVTARYGRGAFVYVGYSLFRQIPAGVPGAFRLLANILALPEALLRERVERIRKLSLLSLMSTEQLMTVARIVSERYERAGTYLCRQGDAAQELFVIIDGEVEIVRHDGGETVRKGVAGQVVGEFAILADIPRTAALRALTDVHLLVISGEHFRSLIHQHVELADNVMRQLVMKLAVD